MGESLNITQDQIEKLKSVFPEVVTEGKIDWKTSGNAWQGKCRV